ncbi:MAG: sulfotransferase, partial [Caulobacteraceae bacterium]
EHARAAITDPRLKPAAEALFRGDPDAAAQVLQPHLEANPNDIVALRMLAEAAVRHGRLADAEVLLRHTLEQAPEAPDLRFSYAKVLFQQQKAAQALPYLEALAALAPNEPAYANLRAGCLSLVGEYAAAIAIYEALLRDFPLQAQIWLNYGHALRTVGRSAEAVAVYKRCITLAPSLGDAYWSLANLKTASFTAEEIAAMAAQLDRADLGAEDRLHLNYALGKALEDRGEHEGAFRRYQAGARLRRETAPYDPEELTAYVRRCKTLFTPGFFERRVQTGDTSTAPIFVVGLPRSGSTLVEQILASHPAVEGTMELSDIGFIAKRLGWTSPGSSYPEAVTELHAEDLAGLGAEYLQTTRIHRKLGRPHFVDKMPTNFQHLGLIHLILPHAKIIDVRRHPLGACFSIFKQHFAQGHSFSYDQEDISRYYRDYVDLMAHFDAVIPGRVHRVIYEDLVQDTEVRVRRLLEYCGLPFDEACLRFHENARAVNTVSSEQVRRPIFREGVDRWRSYEPWLGPAKAVLGPVLEAWRG